MALADDLADEGHVVALTSDEVGVDGLAVTRHDDGAGVEQAEVLGQRVSPVERPAVTTERGGRRLLDEVAEEHRAGIGDVDADVPIRVAAPCPAHRHRPVAEVDGGAVLEGPVRVPDRRRTHLDHVP